ncbi:hypothetical protein BMS3Bbin01_01181 [bacterium BMS3Bbin01]|nr:hypothetical protein BMS3Bbin01_01181 [bacterium BMS3Bbin01]
MIWQLTATVPDAGFTVAIAVLAVLAAAIAAIPPAMVAAWRDPVSILRVPQKRTIPVVCARRSVGPDVATG